MTSKAKTPTSSPMRRRGAGRPTAGDSEATKQKILDAARYCFGEFGYKRTSNRLIAERARLTTGTIYHYFENKRDLFLETHYSTQKEITSFFEQTLEQPTFFQAIQYLLDSFQTLLIERPNYGKFNAIVYSEIRRNPELKIENQDLEWRNLYRDLAALGVSTGELEAQDSMMVRNVLSVLIYGITEHSVEASNTNYFNALRGVERLVLGTLIKPLT